MLDFIKIIRMIQTSKSTCSHIVLIEISQELRCRAENENSVEGECQTQRYPGKM